MKIACIGDIHLIDPVDPRRERVADRSFFIDGQASLRRLFNRLNVMKPDHVIFLGDLVDWASPENIAYAAAFLKQLEVPWSALPGNHDYTNPDLKNNADLLAGRALAELWADHGIDFSNRSIDCGDFAVHLFDNSIGHIEPEALDWLDAALNKQAFNFLCQHVPLDLPVVRACIQQLAPQRNLEHYTCSAHASLFDSHLRGRVQGLASGHVHMSASLQHDQCALFLCNVGIDLQDPHRGESALSSATLLGFDGERFSAEQLFAD